MKRVNIDCVAQLDKRGSTGLMLASEAGHFEVVKLLIENGANVNAKDNYGYPLIHLAICRIEILKLLISKGADIEAVNNYDSTTLMEAINWDADKEIIKTLIERTLIGNADLEKKDMNGFTVLSMAVSKGDIYSVDILVNNGALINNIEDQHLFYAVKFKRYDIVDFLIKKGILLNVQDDKGNTALMNSLGTDSFKLLIDSDVNIQNNKGETALTLSTDPEEIELLMKKGANINHKNKDGDTLIIKICRSKGSFLIRFETLISFLYEKNADFTIVNNDNKSALDILNANESISQQLKSLKEKIILENEIIEENELYPNGHMSISL